MADRLAEGKDSGKVFRGPMPSDECVDGAWHNHPAMKKVFWRGLVEIGFIIFLFYSNLLMGEFERSGSGRANGLLWALSDIFTLRNFQIAIIAASIGFVLVEFLRTRL